MTPFAKLPSLSKKIRRPSRSAIRRPRGLKMKTPRSLNYQRIKEEVEKAISQLSPTKQAMIPPGTLPERMVALAMVRLGWLFESQSSELGGRLFLGGGVIDFKVYIASIAVIVRVNGDYWHSLPNRVLKDAVQWTRLHAKGYRVADIWEHDIYQAWVDGRLDRLVYDAVQGAA